MSVTAAGAPEAAGDAAVASGDVVALVGAPAWLEVELQPLSTAAIDAANAVIANVPLVPIMVPLPDQPLFPII